MFIPRKILIIFDIDETLIQFVNRNQDPGLFEIIRHHENVFDSVFSKNGHCTIFRPHIKELFAFLKSNRDKIDVALWTYSDREYANSIAKMIIQYCELDDPDFFLFKFCDEDIEDEDYPKDLNQVWRKYPTKYNTFNTFLIDDRAANLYHDANIENSVLIQPFAPFGAEAKRVFISEDHLNMSARDNILPQLMKICNALFSDVDGCSDEEIMEAFKVEAVFNPSRVARMGLKKYLKNYIRVLGSRIRDNVKIMTIGEPHLTPKIVVNETSITGGSYIMKARTTRRRKPIKSGLSYSYNRTRITKTRRTKTRTRRTKTKRSSHKNITCKYIQ